MRRGICPGKHEGELAEFTEADISDWMFMRNGKIVGGETIRPLLKSMPKADDSRQDGDALRLDADIEGGLSQRVRAKRGPMTGSVSPPLVVQIRWARR